MNDIQPITGTDIAVIDDTVTAVTVFGTPGGVDAILDKIRRQARALNADISTPAGRKAIASLAYKVARSKTALDDMGKELGLSNYNAWKKITTERARVEAELDALRDEVRKPLTDWEDAEKDRVAGHEAAINELRESLAFYDNGYSTSVELRQRLTFLENLPPRDWQEFAKRAAETIADEIEQTKASLAQAEATEAALIEAERIARDAAAEERRQREASIAAAAAEAARIAAEQKAAAAARVAAEAARQEREAAEAELAASEARVRQAEQDRIDDAAKAKADAEAAELRAQQERDRADRERQEAEARAERAEADRIAAEVKAKADAERAAVEAEANRKRAAQDAAAAERERHADEQARLQREAAAREADRKHRGKINGEARDDLIGKVSGITEEQATAIVVAVARGEVRHTRIAY